MRRWTVQRRRLNGDYRRLAAELERHTPNAVRLPLDSEPPVTLEARASLHPLGAERVELVVVGAFPTPRGISGPLCDVTSLCEQAEKRVAEVLDTLADRLSAAAAPPLVAPLRPARGTGAAARTPLVRDVMDVDAPALNERATLTDAYTLLLSTGHDGAPVVNEQGRLLGVLSDRDLLAGMLRQREGGGIDSERALTVGELCSRPAVVTVPDISCLRAAQQMLYHGVRRLAVIEEGRLIGVCTRTALLAALHSHSRLAAPARGLAAASSPQPA